MTEGKSLATTEEPAADSDADRIFARRAAPGAQGETPNTLSSGAITPGMLIRTIQWELYCQDPEQESVGTFTPAAKRALLAVLDAAQRQLEADAHARGFALHPGLQPRVEFNRLWSESGCQGNGTTVFNGLVSLYGAPERHYHTLAHVMWVVARLRELLPVPGGPGMVPEWAAWFHDAVMGGMDDVPASAGLARETLSRAGLKEAMVDQVCALILATRHDGSELSIAQQVFVDADLSILGAEDAVFDEYEARVRKEWPNVTDREFAEARAAILERFALREHIFYTEAGRALWEDQARRNLTRSLGKLRRDLMAKPKKLTLELDKIWKSEAELLRARRGVWGTPCEKCQGWGRFHYPNTGTWDSHPGDGKIVGHGFTWDVCDACWGSGDASRPGEDLRALESALERFRKVPTAPPPTERDYGLQWGDGPNVFNGDWPPVGVRYEGNPVINSPSPILCMSNAFEPDTARALAAKLLAAADEVERNPKVRKKKVP